MLHLAATDPTPYVAGVSILGLVTAAVSLLVGMTRAVPAAYRDQIDSQADQLERQEQRLGRQEKRITHLETENARCNRRVIALTRALVDAGLNVPTEG